MQEEAKEQTTEQKQLCQRLIYINVYSEQTQKNWTNWGGDPTSGKAAGNQIKSLLLSHHHSTCALMSEILESMLHTVQKQLTYSQYHYILTDLYRWQCAIYTYIYSVHTVYCETYLQLSIHIIHRMYTSTLCTHIYIYIYTHSNMQRCSRYTLNWIRKCHGCALDGIQW